MSNAPASASNSPDRFAPLDLWRAAGAVLEMICQLFGGPEKIAAQHALTRKAHKLIASWLRCAEAMVRRLLAIEAAAYAPSPTPHRARAPRTCLRKEMSFSADAPEQWRVGFRCFVGAKRTPREKPARAGEQAAVLSAWPLAERLEALIRAYNEPAAYAVRLARRLRALPARLAALLRAPPEAAHRIDGFEDVREHALAAWRPHFSSA